MTRSVLALSSPSSSYLSCGTVVRPKKHAYERLFESYMPLLCRDLYRQTNLSTILYYTVIVGNKFATERISCAWI
jgi:hypothetical protein